MTMENGLAGQAVSETKDLVNPLISESAASTAVDSQFQDPESSIALDYDRTNTTATTGSTAATADAPSESTGKGLSSGDAGTVDKDIPITEFKAEPESVIYPNPTSDSIKPEPNSLPSQAADPLALARASSQAVPLDPALDQDAPYEEDEESCEPVYMTTPVNEVRVIKDSIDPPLSANPQSRLGSNTPDLSSQIKSEANSIPTDHAKKTSVPPNAANPPSSGKRKRQQSSGSPAAAPRRSYPRVKPPEQLAAEALIEKQNPHATKNELRSLKLRALHATRIADREKDMSEREKARRLRLREYVRKKREEERLMKAQGLLTSSSKSDGNKSGEEKPDDTSFSFSNGIDMSFHSAPGNITAERSLLDRPDIDQKTFQASSQAQPRPAPINGDLDVNAGSREGTEDKPGSRALKVYPLTSDIVRSQSIPEWHDPQLVSSPSVAGPTAASNGGGVFQTPIRPQNPDTSSSGKNPRRQSSSRVKTPEQASLEARIEAQNPHATKHQLKSLKLRALHAKRIAERELNLSEKEKARRLKLREYMRRRRDEERTQKGELPLDPNSPLKPVSNPVVTTQVVPKPSPPPVVNPTLESTQNPSPSMSRDLNASTELNAADRLAAFSIMELNNYQPHQFSQPSPAPQNPQPHPNLHLHPLFQMPIAAPAVHVENQFDNAIDPTYGIHEPWAQIQRRNLEAINAEHEAQKALHAALEEAIYMKAPDSENTNSNTNSNNNNPNGATTNSNRTMEKVEVKLEGRELNEKERLERMEEERIRIAEEEILGVQRARIAADAEMAMIAAAAAEVERAQLVSSRQ